MALIGDLSATDCRFARQTGNEERPMATAVDEVDHRMLLLLQSDARMSIRTLADRLGISRANAYLRFNRLVDSKVIRDFTIDVDHDALGLQTSAYVEISMEQNSWRAVRDALTRVASVKYVCLLGGAFDALVLVRTYDNHSLRNVILDELQSIEGVTSTRTLLIFEEVRGSVTSDLEG
jgi:DNA-binding Lrp family transcriptional regulator